MSKQNYGLINKWLLNIKDVYRLHRNEIDSLPTEEEKNNKLVELNVQEQILNLAKTSIVQKAWKAEQRPQLHGWVYSLHDGIIKSVCDMDAYSPIDPVYQYE